jgi:LiaI-LiaF-like transmembrane region
MQNLELRDDERPYHWGRLVFGLLILVIGAYLLLKDALGLDIPEVKGDALWPLILIGVGAVVLLRTLTESGRRSCPWR